MKKLIAIFVTGLMISGCRYSHKESASTETDENDFLGMMKRGDVSSYIVVDQTKEVRVYLVKDSLYKYETRLEKNGQVPDPKKPQFFFRVVSSSIFMKDMKKFFEYYPMTEKIPYKLVRD